MSTRGVEPRLTRDALGLGISISAGIIALQALVLYAMGHPPTCTCGVVRFWTGAVSSSEISQQITDWYTFTHILHGFLFYLLLWFLMPRMPLGVRLAIAVGLEASWEVVENTPFIIDRYRQSALAFGYFGDSIINSVSDTLAATIGFALARKLPVGATAVAGIGLELFLAVMVHDNLTLNIVQLIHPNAAIAHWQIGR